MTNKSSHNQVILPASSRWGVFLVSTVIMFIIAMMAIGVIGQYVTSLHVRMLISSLIQGTLVFILPVLATWRLTSHTPWHDCGMSTAPSFRGATVALLLYLTAYPAITQTIWWNQNMHLPEYMAGIEAGMRQLEESAAESSNAILASTSVVSLIVNILVIGFFTGVAEEMFFRAGLQRMLCMSGVPAWGAILIASFIFSAVHLQFFGFVPRLLLGAMFGYVYLRTGSIWTAAGLHGINNSIVVVFAWLSKRGILAADPDKFLVQETGFPLIFTISLILSIMVIMYWNHSQQSKKR